MKHEHIVCFRAWNILFLRRPKLSFLWMHNVGNFHIEPLEDDLEKLHVPGRKTQRRGEDAFTNLLINN